MNFRGNIIFLCGLGLLASPISATQFGPTELFPTPVPDEIDYSETAATKAAENPDFSKTGEKIIGSTLSSDAVTGALTGRIVYLMGGHGWSFTSTGNPFTTQRGETNEMYEDFGNLDQASIMAEMLLNAGATVVPTRGLGIQELEVVVDNDDPTVTFTGTWSNSSSSNFYGTTGDVPYRFASTVTGTATATAVFNASTLITEAGQYPVYVWTRTGNDRINQQYIIASPGGSVTRRINHRAVGSGWIYVGTYYFEPGQTASVTITNLEETGDTGSVVIADAVRFGNGMGDARVDGQASGHPRQEENGSYWLAESIGLGSGLAYSDSVSSPPRLATYMNNSGEGTNTTRAYLSFHSNAGGGRGADGLFNATPTVANCGDPATANSFNTPNGVAYSQKLGTAVNTNMNALTSGSLAPNPLAQTWGQTGAGTNLFSSACGGGGGFSAFGEINNSYFNDEMAASLIEVAFHDSSLDADILRDPKGREALAMACLQATIDHFAAVSGSTTTAPPDRPENPAIESDNAGNLTLSWKAPVAGGTYGVGGDAPTGYIIQVSENGKNFTTLQTISGGATLSASVTASVPLNDDRYFRVAATNAGGVSFPSPVVGAHRKTLKARALIVNGFDRYGTSLNYRQTEPSLGTTFDRTIPRYNNRFDYIGDVGKSLQLTGTSFDSCLNDSVINGDVVLTDYDHVFWILGAESTADSCFNATEQTLVSNFLAANGNLFVSGSELGWDLGRTAASAGNKTFLETKLRVTRFASGDAQDDAGTYNATSVAGPFNAVGALTFSNGADINGDYNVAFPDVMVPINGSQTILNYSGGLGGSAGVYYNGNATNTGRVVVLGFPQELVLDVADRNALIQAAINEFNTNSNLNDWIVYAY